MKEIMVSLEDYRTFLAVARRGGFVRAERELGRTQATISKRILRLERALGVRLLDRGGARAVAPTPAGRRLLTLIAPLIEAAESIPGQFRQRLAGSVLRLVGDQPALLHELPPVVVPFLRAHPETRIIIRPIAGGALIDALDQNEADLGLTVRRTLRDGLTFLRLRKEPICAVAAPGHPLPDGPLALETLVRSDRILPDDDDPVQRLLAGVCPEWNAEPARLEVADWRLTRAFVAAGGGIGFVPAEPPASGVEPLAIVPTECPLPHLELGLVARQDALSNPVLRELLLLVFRQFGAAWPPFLGDPPQIGESVR